MLEFAALIMIALASAIIVNLRNKRGVVSLTSLLLGAVVLFDCVVAWPHYVGIGLGLLATVAVLRDALDNARGLRQGATTWRW